MQCEARLCILPSSMKNKFTTTLLVAILSLGQIQITHAEAEENTDQTTAVSNILITEIQTGGVSTATEEFVEIYNPNSVSVDITGWLLQYRSASSLSTQNWANSTTKAEVACADTTDEDCKVLIQPEQRVVFVNDITDIADSIKMDGGFSNKGGQIRLMQPNAETSEVVIQDFVGYGTAVDAEGSPAPAPTSGYSIKRIVDDQGEPIDTDDNSNDFITSCGAPTPGQADTESIPYESGCYIPTVENTDDTTDEETIIEATEDSQETTTETEATIVEVVYSPLIITEVFPDPASPQLDGNDEFIEIYNPNDIAVNLKDYVLQTGSNFRYSYTLGDTPLGSYSYLAITSSVSNLSLANSGSGVRLLDPNGTIVYEAASYGKAEEGQSWIQDETGWHWTTTPTPGATNVLSVAAAKSSSSTSTKSTTKKSSSSSSSAKAPTSTKSTSDSDSQTDSQNSSTSSAWKPQYWLVVPIAVLVLGYIIYEYRQEISRTFQKIKRSFTRKKKIIVSEDDSCT